MGPRWDGSPDTATNELLNKMEMSVFHRLYTSKVGLWCKQRDNNLDFSLITF